ncbi:hypothetical protein ABH926_002112 [Catenulispora sp. GP43]|uniref:hypothetical protein n=1 Tax=Catenulispora sp. GP43 TaxID=3156263 RepID=UPI0035180BC0
MQTPLVTTTFVLVHGAWHRPSTFDLLRAELDALGHPSTTVNLPTAGPDPHGGLAEDAWRAATRGVARSTFYLHFRDKTALLLQLIENLADGAFDLIAGGRPRRLRRGGGARRRLLPAAR